MLRPLLIALQFLTRLPVSLSVPPGPGETGRSLLYYPLIGLLIGLLMLLTALLLVGQEDLLAATLVVLVWVLITGGLHLDGLADTVDGWIGGMGDRERTLAIMRDPAIGPMGVISLVLVLLLKAAAVYALVAGHSYYALLIPPVLGRTSVLLLLISTPYVRREGLAAVLAREADRKQCLLVSGLTALILLACKPLAAGVALLAGAAMLLVWRNMLLSRLGGYTGDTIGAQIEAVEVVSLVVLALLT